MTIWLSRQVVLAIHDEQIANHGGVSGIRDDSLLESALARPLNCAAYIEADTTELAALYAVAIARNHLFLDGNKRTAYACLETFLRLNGLRFDAADAECVVAMVDMASGELTDDEFIAWVRLHANSEA